MCNSCNVLDSLPEQNCSTLYGILLYKLIHVASDWSVLLVAPPDWSQPRRAPILSPKILAPPRVVKFTRVRSFTKSPLFDNHFVSPTCTGAGTYVIKHSLKNVQGHYADNMVWTATHHWRGKNFGIKKYKSTNAVGILQNLGSYIFSPL